MEGFYEFRGHTLDARERALYRGSTRVNVRRRSFDLLCVLAAHAGRLVDRATLFERVWGDVAVSDGVLKVAVRELRAALRDDARTPAFIETVAKSGYRFVAPLGRARAAPAIRQRGMPDVGGLIGRGAELAMLRDALAGSLRCVHLHGIGGIGKTTLANALLRHAAASRIATARLDARDVACLPRDFLRALARALGKPTADPIATLRARRGRTLVVVDSCEHLVALDRWLREDLVRALPPRTLLVLSGRLAPSADWRGEGAWNETMRELKLEALAPDAAREILRARGVADRHDAAALRLTHGHPLALCLVADLVARRPDSSLELADAPDVVQALLARVVMDVDDDRQQAALDVCGLVRHVSEPLLAAMLGGRDARRLLRWLATLSFIEIGPGGLFPHDLARDVLFGDLKWRNPARLTELVERASAYFAERLRGGELRVADELLFLHSHHPVIGAFTRWRGTAGLVVEPARSDDVPHLVAIVARQEGAASAAIAARWLARQLDGALVVRDAQAIPAGFELTIRLDAATPDEIAADPIAQLAARHAGKRQRGHAILLHRYLMARDTYQAHSPIQSLLGSQVMRAYMTTPKLDWAFTCMAEPEQWAAPLEQAFGARLLPPFDHDGRHYGLFWHCFRDLSPAAWLAWLARRGIERESAATHARILDREELQAAIRTAFAGLHRPSALDDNALLDSHLLVGAKRTGAESRTSAIRTLLLGAVDTLTTVPRGDRLRLALHHAYLEVAPSQEIAAKRAGMAFSTYRRSVGKALDHVVDHLWQLQRAGH